MAGRQKRPHLAEVEESLHCTMLVTHQAHSSLGGER